MTRVAIVGCGKVADQHAVQIQRIPDCKIVGLCDLEVLMAKQMSERFGVSSHFDDVEAMLKAVKPDIVHITTTPQSHYALGKICLEAGCHVYMEKPFTVYASEAEELIELATRQGLKMTAGHNAQFTHANIRMRQLVKEGYLGGAPVHMESIYCYNLGDQAYARALLGDRNHWVRRLPGSLLQNIISHGISKIAEFLTSENPTVIAHGFTSRLLSEIGEDEIIDEVRVIIQDESPLTAYFTFSSQIGPTVHQFRIYGPKNSLVVDDDHQVVLKMRKTGYKSYLNYFLPPFDLAGQYIGNLRQNVKKFIKHDFHPHFDAGMKYLIAAFYRSVRNNDALPISYREIIVTAKIMDSIFVQVNASRRL